MNENDEVRERMRVANAGENLWTRRALSQCHVRYTLLVKRRNPCETVRSWSAHGIGPFPISKSHVPQIHWSLNHNGVTLFRWPWRGLQTPPYVLKAVLVEDISSHNHYYTQT